jgi:hypothetical protein
MATPDTTLTRRRVCRHSRRAASALALSGVAALALAVTGNAFAGGSDPLLSDSSAGLPDLAGPSAEALSESVNPAAQPEESNDASSAQPPGSEEASSLEAATQQAATAVAGATQNNVQNIVVIIRINSPGDDVISQNNTANAGAVATNTSTTQQGGGATGPTDPPDSATSTGARAEGTPPTATPGRGEPPVTTSAAAPALRVATAGPERARPRVTAVQRPKRDRDGGSHKAAGASAPAQVGTGSKPSRSAAAPQVAPRQAAAAAQRSASAPSARSSRPSVTSVPARIGQAAAMRVGAGAAHFIGSLAPRSARPADEFDPVSTAVVMTLLAVMLVVLLGVGSTYLPKVRVRAWR